MSVMSQTKQTPLLGAADACARIGIDRSTLSRWVQIGKATPAMRLHGTTGAFLFTVQEVERLAAEYTAGTAA